ncbi:MAG: GIY-YIG nuclease family protein [Butyricicoccaceae bacterium]
MYFVYMLRCEDDSIYTGITVDVARRMREHFGKDKKCAKYTIRHSAKRLECVWQTENRILASRLEYRIKRLTKRQKEQLVSGAQLDTLPLEKIEPERYIRMERKKEWDTFIS